MCSRISVFFIMWISVSLCDQRYDNANRNKRFFYNLTSYFWKNDSKENTLTTEQLRNAHTPCKSNEKNCSISKYDNSEGVINPVTYLTPPILEYDNHFNQKDSKYFSTHDYQTNQNNQYPTDYYYNFKTNSSQNMLNDKNSIYFVTFDSLSPSETDSLKMNVKDVTCIKFGGHGRFSVSMITSRILPTLPVIENENIENLSQCSVNIINPTTFEINLQESDMIKCGVHYCNSDSDINLMCLILRFPIIYGIKTNNDIIVKIECRPQPQIVTHIKQLHLKLQANNIRSLPVHSTVTGGSTLPELHSQIGLYRMTETGFTQQLRNNDYVIIGQQLQLRCIINKGDGWNYSRLGQVLIQKVLSPLNGYSYGEEPDSIVVVADDGCVNPLIKSLCPRGPFNDPGNPLISILNLQMFTFNNMKESDELSMTITVIGCVHYEDCFPRNNVCEEWSKSIRYKRSFRTQNTSDITSEIKLRIQHISAKHILIRCNENECHKLIQPEPWKITTILLYSASLTIILLTGYLICFCSNIKYFIEFCMK